MSRQEERFTGIFGLWPWPILNLILSIIRSRGGSALPSAQSPSRNVERWEAYRDERGRLIIEVHREVE